MSASLYCVVPPNRVCALTAWRARVCTLLVVRMSVWYPPPRVWVGVESGGSVTTKLLVHIRQVLTATPFLGEGYRKVWAKLRWRHSHELGRVMRLMREHNL